MNPLRFKSLYLLMLSLFLACEGNVFEKHEEVDPLDASVRELEKGNTDKSFELLLKALPANLAQVLTNEKISVNSINLVHEKMGKHKNKGQIMGLISVLLARKSGVNILAIGEKLAKSKKGLEPDELINEIIGQLSKDGNIIAQIDAAIAASKFAGGGSSSDRLQEAILHSASIAARIKSIDLDGDNKITADEIKNLSTEDSESIHHAFQESLSRTKEAAAAGDDKDLEKIKEKMEKLNSQISKTTGDSNGEKVINYLGEVMGEIEPEVAQAPVIDTSVEMKSDLPVTVVQGKRVVRSMAVLGDSLAVGIGSDFSRGASIPFNSIASHPGIASLLSFIGFPGYENYEGDTDAVMKAAYDSAYSATRQTIEACRNRFDSGKCFSHASRLKASYVKNFAQSGSKIQDILNNQIPELIKMNPHLDYVAINIGGNDFCSSGLNLETFERDYQEVLKKLYDYRSKPIVMIAGVPNVVSLFRSVSDDEAAFHLKSDVTGNFDFTCGEVRWKFCPRATAFKDQLSSQSGLIHDMTAAIRRVIDKVDPDGKRLFFAESLKDLEVSKSMIGIDCFHTDVNGYRAISDITFSAVDSAIVPNQ